MAEDYINYLCVVRVRYTTYVNVFYEEVFMHVLQLRIALWAFGEVGSFPVGSLRAPVTPNMPMDPDRRYQEDREAFLEANSF